MMFIPVTTVAINHHMTMVGHFGRLRTSPTLRFVVFGAMSYTVVSFQGSLQALRSVNEVSHFTHYTVAHAHLGVYSFFTMVMFGVDLLHRAAADRARVGVRGADQGPLLGHRASAWRSTGAALTWGGWIQGLMMNDPDVPVSDGGARTPFLTLARAASPAC